MSAIAGSLPITRSSTQLSTLAAELEQRGLVVYPLSVVEEYKTKLVRETVANAGKLRLLRPLAYVMYYLRFYAIIFVSFAAAAGVCAWQGLWIFATLAGIGSASILVVFIVYMWGRGAGRRRGLLFRVCNDFGDAGAHWRRVKARSWLYGDWKTIPAAAKTACQEAETVPGVSVEIEHFLDDPLMFAVRGGWLQRKERCLIAYWAAYELEGMLEKAQS